MFTWIPSGDLKVDLALRMDALSGLMCLVITFIGTLIHIYSAGYMSHEPDYARFFAYLNLFCGAMLVLVLGDSLPVMFIGWEGVGLCSYLLIGFWYGEKANADAGKKAFIVNRVGDFGFLLGMFLLFYATGTLDIPDIIVVGQAGCRAESLDPAAVAGPAGGLLGGAVPVRRRLRQVGPDPAVRLAARRHGRPHPGLGADPRRHHGHRRRVHGRAPGGGLRDRTRRRWPSWPLVGALTALFAAIIGFAQNDFKKVLAYSTVSQLGFMFAGVGSGAFGAGIFHLYTHAFFKAGLFLCAGSVMHAMGGSGDITKMGGLRKYLPWTHGVFFVCWLAICGLPVFSGFFSKDAIVAGAFGTHIYGRAAVLGGPAGRRHVAGGRAVHGVLHVPPVLPGVHRRRRGPTSTPGPISTSRRSRWWPRW